MCDKEFCYSGAHVAGGDDGEGSEGRHCGRFSRMRFEIWWVSELDRWEKWVFLCDGIAVCYARYGGDGHRRYSEKRKEITSSCIMSDLQSICGAF